MCEWNLGTMAVFDMVSWDDKQLGLHFRSVENTYKAHTALMLCFNWSKSGINSAILAMNFKRTIALQIVSPELSHSTWWSMLWYSTSCYLYSPTRIPSKVSFRRSTSKQHSCFIIMALHKMFLIALAAFLAIVPQVHSCIILYEHGNFVGASTRICASNRNIGSFWNDKMTSYRVLSGRWILYEHSNFRGRTWFAQTRSRNVKWFNDKLTSLRRV